MIASFKIANILTVQIYLLMVTVFLWRESKNQFICQFINDEWGLPPDRWEPSRWRLACERLIACK